MTGSRLAESVFVRSFVLVVVGSDVGSRRCSSQRRNTSFDPAARESMRSG